MSEKVPMTMKDIARELGVSVATVSRALQDNPSISKERREMIQAFAREHNYYPNVIAEQLRHSKSSPVKIIGVIVPEFMHYYFASILTGIEEEASARGYRIIVAQSREEYEREVAICKSFFQNKVCGIIVSQAKDTTKYTHFERLIENGVPLVFYDRICPAVNASRVVVDDYMGTLKAVSYLIETGCKRVAYYGASLNMEIAKNRFNGYKDALQRNGIAYDDRYVRFCDTRREAEVITPGMLKMEDRPDAFFAINDNTAIGILYTAKRMGLSVPGDVSICGFTNGDMAEACEPQLTTVEQRGVMVGKEAVSILVDKVEGRIDAERVEKRVVKTRLVVRGTTR